VELSATLWHGLTSLGGGSALAFIVLMALGMIALTLVYCASAVVVLDRFARVEGGTGWRIAAGAGVTLLGSILYLQFSRPELRLASWSEYLEVLAAILPGAAVLVGMAMVLVRLVVVHADPGRAGALFGLVSAGAFAGAAGAAGLPEIALALALVPLLGFLFLLVRRRSRGGGRPGGPERGLFVLALVLVAGCGSTFLSGEAREAVWGASVGLLGVLGLGVMAGLLPLAVAGLLQMRRSAEWFIAVRYLVARRRQVFISAISAICILGIAAGVWLIVVVLSVMNGFEQTWREEILGNRAHFVLESQAGAFSDYRPILQQVEAMPGVVAASPFVDVDAMVRGRAGEIYSLRVRGVDPSAVVRVTRLGEDMVSGSLAHLEDSGSPQPGAAEAPPHSADPGIVIGNQLASALALDLGDPLVVISPLGGPPTPLGPSPRLARFRVDGVFQSSFYQFDEAFAYVTLAAAQAFKRVGDEVDGIEALTTDHYRSGRVADAVAGELGYPFSTRDWKEFFPAFFQALKTERIMMFMLLTMIMVVAAFVIVATLIMMIMEKSGDIAILKAMGAEDASVERIFALEGTLIGLVGTSLGVLAALAVTHRLAWIQDRIQSLTGVDALPASLYQFSTLPSRLDPLQVAGVATIAMVLSLGATLLPSRQGARIDPAEGLRHE